MRSKNVNHDQHKKSGQAIIEYILMVVMLSVTVAVVIKNSNLTIYNFWTGLAAKVASPCTNCVNPPPPFDQ